MPTTGETGTATATGEESGTSTQTEVAKATTEVQTDSTMVEPCNIIVKVPINKQGKVGTPEIQNEGSIAECMGVKKGGRRKKSRRRKGGRKSKRRSRKKARKSKKSKRRRGKKSKRRRRRK